jgi:hypothetical protein
MRLLTTNNLITEEDIKTTEASNIIEETDKLTNIRWVEVIKDNIRVISKITECHNLKILCRELLCQEHLCPELQCLEHQCQDRECQGRECQDKECQELQWVVNKCLNNHKLQSKGT